MLQTKRAVVLDAKLERGLERNRKQFNGVVYLLSRGRDLDGIVNIGELEYGIENYRIGPNVLVVLDEKWARLDRPDSELVYTPVYENRVMIEPASVSYTSDRSMHGKVFDILPNGRPSDTYGKISENDYVPYINLHVCRPLTELEELLRRNYGRIDENSMESIGKDENVVLVRRADNVTYSGRSVMMKERPQIKSVLLREG
jgi:hypothetical protein